MKKEISQKMFLHVDGDSFFVSCELTARPDLKGRPVVTGSERGIVSAMSQEAKMLGITRAMPVFKAKQLCKNLAVLESNFGLYRKYARRMASILRRYTERVEVYSIDECFVDITGLDEVNGCTHEKLAEEIQATLCAELGITFSVGIGPTKTIAKIASGFRKPKGLTIVSNSDIDSFTKKVLIDDVWGIGRKGAMKALGCGLVTAYDFAHQSDDMLRKFFRKPILGLAQELRGMSCFRVVANNYKDDPLSIRSTRSFISTSDKNKIFSWIIYHIEQVCRSLRIRKLTACKITLLLREKNLKYHSIEVNYPGGFNASLEITNLISSSFNDLFNATLVYKTAGVVVSQLRPEGVQQPLNLFGEATSSKKYRELMSVVDYLNIKNHHTVVRSATNRVVEKEFSLIESMELPFLGYVN